MKKQIIDLKIQEDGKQTVVNLCVRFEDKEDIKIHAEIMEGIKKMWEDGMEVIYQNIDYNLIRCSVEFATDTQMDVIQTLFERGYNF